MLEIGRTISHCRAIKRLGQGGMGEVFLAHDTWLDRNVALNFLAKAFPGDIPATDASTSPKLTDQMTRPGVILGTAAYMAPEQAKGLRLYHAVVLLGARRYDDALSQARLAGSGLAVRAQPGNLPALGVLVVAAHMKQQYAEAIAAGAVGYEGIGGRTSPRCSRRATPNRTTPARCDRLPRWNWRSMEGSQA